MKLEAVAVLLVVVLVAVAAVHSQPAPPYGIPKDWLPAWQQSDLLFTTNEPTDELHQTYVGNGYMATVVGQPQIYVSGIFTGNMTASRRARIQATNAISIQNPTMSVGSALNMRQGVFYRRSTWKEVCIGCPVFTIEQRWYAHRYYPSLLVHEMEVVSDSNDGRQFSMPLVNASGPLSVDVNITQSYNGNGFWAYEARSAEPEVVGFNSALAVVTTLIPESLNLNSSKTPTTYYWITAIRTTLDSPNPYKDALADYTAAQQSAKTLMSSHIREWEAIWESGIEVGNRFELAQVVNSSLYYLLSSIRPGNYDTSSTSTFSSPSSPNVPQRFGSSFAIESFSTSPGSLATVGYGGHTFWDADLWMYPTLALFYPEIGRNFINYRYNRRQSAVTIAQQLGYPGYKFPWESAVTGLELCGWLPGQMEIHLNGAVGLSVELFWHLTHDTAWLKSEGLPLLKGLADFWAARASYNATLGAYEVLNVVGPDEEAGYTNGVNNNAYTNSLVQVNLAFAVDIFTAMGQPVDPKWHEIANNLYIPRNETGKYHPEYDGYKWNQTIKQADAALMVYPVAYDMPEDWRRGDLAYYESVIDPTGPAMTWGMFAIGWLELGEVEQSYKNFNQSYQININQPFLAWQETATGGCHHFLTGTGGFLQGLWAGYGGIRPLSDGLHISPNLPELSDFIKFRSLSYVGNRLDVAFDGKTLDLTLVVESGAGTSLYAVPTTGSPVKLTKGTTASFPVSAGPFVIQDK